MTHWLLKKASNLSDLANKETARSNLDVYSKSEVDSKHELDLKKAENLSDLADTEQAISTSRKFANLPLWEVRE